MGTDPSWETVLSISDFFSLPFGSLRHKVLSTQHTDFLLLVCFSTTRGARLLRLVLVPLCFMANWPWSTEEGMPTRRDGRRRVVWCLKTTRPMRDARLAYFQCARHNPAALRHDVLDGPGTQRGEVCRISTEEFCRNRTRVPCCNTRQTRAVRHKLAVNISLVVGGPRCPSQHKFCQKQKSRNAKIHIRQNG